MPEGDYTPGSARWITNPDGSGGAWYFQNERGQWVQAPYGSSPGDVTQYAEATPEERLVADILGNAEETRDTNRTAVLSGFGDVAAGQSAADINATAAENDLFQQQAARTAEANARDLGLYSDVATAGNLATGMDLQTLNALLGLSGDVSTREQAALGDFTGAARAANTLDLANYDALNTATDSANRGDDAALLGLRFAHGDIDQIDPQGYGADLASQAALAAGDPRAIEAQYDVLDEYGERSGTGLTAAARYMMEQARRTEESDRRNAMQAQLRDLAARGQLGSGAEIGAMLGAQSQTSQNRMLQDLAALAQAEGRSDRMLGARADLASQLRGQSFGEQYQTGTSADRMAEFNRAQSLDHTRWMDEFQRQQEQQAWQNAQELYGAETVTVGREYDRSGNLYDAGQETVAGLYGREGDVYETTTQQANADFDRGTQVADAAFNTSQSGYDRMINTAGTGIGMNQEIYNRDLGLIDQGYQNVASDYGREQDRQGNVIDFTGLYTNQGARDSAGVNDALRTELGQREARRAEEMLEEDFDITDPGSWF